MEEKHQPTTLRKAMCEECPHKNMNECIQVFHEYPDTPHPCHMLPGYACRGAYVELKMRNWLRTDFKPDCENGV